MSDEEVDEFMSLMEANAVETPQIELNPTNWFEQFGKDGKVTTPIGSVKMGENQIPKLFENKRSKEFGMIKPTLEQPLVIVEVPSEAKEGQVAERGTSYLFIKTFIGKNGERVYFYKSVTVKVDGMEVSVSSHYDRSKRIKNALKIGKLLYRFDGGAQTKHRPADVSVTASPEIVQGISEDKGTQNSENKQENGKKSSSPLLQAEHEVNTQPTEAQKEAGNFKKGHVTVDGYRISIDNPKGSKRRGMDAASKEWETEMHNDYGYIRGTEGVDGDHIDVYLSDHPESGKVFVVDQVDPKTGEFDEHKVMYGFTTAEEARKAYLSNYEEGWQGLGNITECSKEDFKKWVNSSKRKTKPFADYAQVKKKVHQQESVEGAPADNNVMEIDHENWNWLFNQPKRNLVGAKLHFASGLTYEVLSTNGIDYKVRIIEAPEGKENSVGKELSIRTGEVLNMLRPGEGYKSSVEYPKKTANNLEFLKEIHNFAEDTEAQLSWVDDHKDDLAELYFSNQEKQGKGNVLDPDEICLLLDVIGYDGTNVPEFKKAGDTLAEYIYDKMLDRAIAQGNKSITFLTGTPGAGKSTATKNKKEELAGRGIVYDSALNKFSKLDAKMQKAINAGMEDVAVMVVYNDARTTVLNTLDRGKRGQEHKGKKFHRYCALDYIRDAFNSNIGKIQALIDKYGDTADITYTDNSGNNGGRVVTAEEALQWDYSISDELQYELISIIDNYEGIDDKTKKSLLRGRDRSLHAAETRTRQVDSGAPGGIRERGPGGQIQRSGQLLRLEEAIPRAPKAYDEIRERIDASVRESKDLHGEITDEEERTTLTQTRCV